MNAERLGRLARILRVRQMVTQVALSARAGVSRRAVAALERGHARLLTLGALESIVHALGGRLDVRILWNGRHMSRRPKVTGRVGGAIGILRAPPESS